MLQRPLTVLALSFTLCLAFGGTARAEDPCAHWNTPIFFLLIHESPLTDALFLLVSKSDEVTTT